MAKKLTYEEVKEYIESQGYKLLSGEYVNARTKITLEDEEGYLYSTTFNNFRKCGKLYIAHSTNRRKRKSMITKYKLTPKCHLEQDITRLQV